MNYRDDFTFNRKLSMLTISIGLLFFYFGILKLFPSASPAEEIGCITVCKLCLGLLPPKICLFLLAALEITIGSFLIARKYLRIITVIAISHLVMTFSPIIFFPDLIFQDSFLTPSLLGQYIYKNIIIIFALVVIFPVKNTLSLDNA